MKKKNFEKKIYLQTKRSFQYGEIFDEDDTRFVFDEILAECGKRIDSGYNSQQPHQINAIVSHYEKQERRLLTFMRYGFNYQDYVEHLRKRFSQNYSKKKLRIKNISLG